MQQAQKLLSSTQSTCWSKSMLPQPDTYELFPPEKWDLYPHFAVRPLYGWRTTNFVESEQARSLKLKPRM